MTRGQEETSTSQVGRRKGSSQESPTMSSLVASMSMEELRSFCRVLDGISLVSNTISTTFILAFSLSFPVFGL